MNAYLETDELSAEAGDHFRKMVASVGVKRFAAAMDLSTRQINRMLSGAQPNPIERIIRCLQSSEPDIGDDTLSFICQEAGGYFIKDEVDLDKASCNAVKECAEAIAAISDGKINRVDEREVREAICALTALLRNVQHNGRAAPDLSAEVTVGRVGAASANSHPSSH